MVTIASEIGRGIFDFPSATTERILTKLDKNQVLVPHVFVHALVYVLFSRWFDNKDDRFSLWFT